MKKINLLLIMLLTVSLSSFSQINTKKTNFYNSSTISEANSIKLNAKNPVSKFNFAKFEFEIDNQSLNFVYFKQEEVVLKFGTQEYSPVAKKKGLVIRPLGKRSPTLKVDNGKDFLVNEFEVIPGGLYTFPAKGEPVDAEEFHLPATKNSFEAGDFTVLMKKIKKQTDETVVQFECTYMGENIGLVSPVNASIKTEDGTLWANARTKDKTKVLFKGDKIKFTVFYRIPGKYFDMQFAQMDIVWKDVFSVTKMSKIDFPSGNITIDEFKTSEKNK